MSIKHKISIINKGNNSNNSEIIKKPHIKFVDNSQEK